MDVYGKQNHHCPDLDKTEEIKSATNIYLVCKFTSSFLRVIELFDSPVVNDIAPVLGLTGNVHAPLLLEYFKYHQQRVVYSALHDVCVHIENSVINKFGLMGACHMCLSSIYEKLNLGADIHSVCDFVRLYASNQQTCIQYSTPDDPNLKCEDYMKGICQYLATVNIVDASYIGETDYLSHLLLSMHDISTNDSAATCQMLEHKTKIITDMLLDSEKNISQHIYSKAKQYMRQATYQYHNGQTKLIQEIQTDPTEMTHLKKHVYTCIAILLQSISSVYILADHIKKSLLA